MFVSAPSRLSRAKINPLLMTSVQHIRYSSYFPFKLFRSYTSTRYCLSSQDNQKNNQQNSSFFNRFSIDHHLKSLIHTIGLTDDEDLSRLLSKSVKYGVYGVLGMTVLGTIGFDTKPILASVGVLGVAGGYALKDAATHFTSGVMLVLQKPFKKGDFIKLLLAVPHEGIVDAIDVRYVHLKTKDNKILLIPCSVVYANSIVVSSQPPSDWPSTSPSNSAPNQESSTSSSSPPSPPAGSVNK